MTVYSTCQFGSEIAKKHSGARRFLCDALIKRPSRINIDGNIFIKEDWLYINSPYRDLRVYACNSPQRCRPSRLSLTCNQARKIIIKLCARNTHNVSRRAARGGGGGGGELKVTRQRRFSLGADHATTRPPICAALFRDNRDDRPAIRLIGTNSGPSVNYGANDKTCVPFVQICGWARARTR